MNNNVKLRGYLFLVVGVGGTGGNFAKELCRMVSQHPDKENIKIYFIDGDLIEDKNLSRQPYTIDDIAENKAFCLADKCSETFNLDILSYPNYIQNVEELLEICNSYRSCLPVIVGCVDNHACRKILHEVFEKLPHAVYLDAGNESTYGDVVCGIKANNKVIAPDKTFYAKEILKGEHKGKNEMSCAELKQDNLQYFATNLMASNILLSFITDLTVFKNLKGGIVYFDIENKSNRFYAYEEMSGDKV